MAPVASYSYDEAGTTVKDYSNANDFSLVGSNVSKVAGGHTNNGLGSSGTTKAVLSPIGQTNSRTLMSWIKSVESYVDNWLIEWHINSIDSGAWGFLNLSGQIHVQARNAGGFARASAPLPSDGAWHHYAGRYDGSNIDLIIDGALVASTPLAGPLRTDADFISIGGWSTPAVVLDDTRIDDSALSLTAIQTAKNTPVGAISLATSLSIADQARVNMLAALVLAEPQPLSNVDLMKRVIDAGGLGLVTVTNLTAGEQYERYVESLSA